MNLEFIQKGVTTRDELAQKLAWMDTGAKEDRLFIGRWFDSRWGVFWMGAAYYAADAGWNRKWNNHDLLVEFDSAGLVQQYRVLTDKQLAVELSAWAAQGQTFDLSAPIEVLVNVDTPSSDQFLLGSDHSSVATYIVKASTALRSVPPRLLR